MGLLLDMSPRSLEEVIYFASYVVVDPGPTGLEKKSLNSASDNNDFFSNPVGPGSTTT
jgi:DNA-directed RNA polymerase subunit beta'